MTLCALTMKPKTMVSAKQEVVPGARSSVLVNNTQQRSVIATSNSGEIMRCKRKLGFLPGQTPAYPSQPASVARRNARERNRVKQVNNGFATLRSHIPPAVAAAIATDKSTSRSSAASKKLSKVETLKMAVEYIRSLQELLDEHGGLEKKDIYEGEDERYYSSSPETVVSSEPHYYPQSPEPYGKSETSDPSYYSPTRSIVKTEKHFEHFNPEVHDTLTAEFYHARSPSKVYSSPERTPPEAHTQAFLPPRAQVREHRGSSSLSPPMSDACPSPTPSYASDNSSLHPGSTSSGGLSLQLSRLSTVPPHTPLPPPPRRGSPGEYDTYDAISPEDEELLDVISWWQQSN